MDGKFQHHFPVHSVAFVLPSLSLILITVTRVRIVPGLIFPSRGLTTSRSGETKKYATKGDKGGVTLFGDTNKRNVFTVSSLLGKSLV